MSNEKLIVALDVSSLNEAAKLVKILSPAVKIFKVGKELFTAAGPDSVRMVHAHGAKVFLDLKFHDIPNTVASACRAAAALGVFMMNVHGSGGSKMMKEAAQAAKGVKVLGVTVLTSLSDADLKEIGISSDVKTQVLALAKLAKTSGLQGVVASPQEIGFIRKAVGKDFLIVTPGVRPEWAVKGDQKRVMTPREAITAGADFIVVGRPVIEAQNPREAAGKILKEIGQS